MQIKGRTIKGEQELDLFIKETIQVHLMNLRHEVFDYLIPCAGFDPRAPEAKEILKKHEQTEISDVEYHLIEKSARQVLNKLIKGLENQTGLQHKALIAEHEKNNH
tara:strand:+ start:913 stop:1230 length:318 start_codon:yes stop_codon:yes gene_type:complete